MRYVWDSAKDVENLRKHGLRLGEGIAALNDPDCTSEIDSRVDCGEELVISLGRSNHRMLIVISTEVSAERTRIISVRKAKKREELRYYDG